MGKSLYAVYHSPLGLIGLVSSERGLVRLGFYKDELQFKRWVKERYPEAIREDNFFKPLFKQLNRYFQGRRVIFRFPLELRGTHFQRKVWETLLKIPYGEVRSYGWVAEQVGRPKAQRAVGNAVASNPIAIIIPCHRVVRSDGSIGGYGYGVEMKKKLLELEGAHYKHKR